MKINIKQYIFRKLWKFILFHLDRKAYDSAIFEKVKNRILKNNYNWHKVWQSQHEATGKNWINGYNLGYEDAKQGIKSRTAFRF